MAVPFPGEVGKEVEAAEDAAREADRTISLPAAGVQ